MTTKPSAVIDFLNQTEILDADMRPIEMMIEFKRELRELQLRRAVKAAEQAVENAWLRSGIARTDLALDDKRRQLREAKAAARQAIREDLRAQMGARRCGVGSRATAEHHPAAAMSDTPTMTKRKAKWVLVLEDRSIIGDTSCAVGPFDSEEQARNYANSADCDGDDRMYAMLLLRPDPARKVRRPGKIR